MSGPDKPELGTKGCWVDPGYLSAKIRSEMLLALNRSKLDAGQKTHLIDFANDMAQSISLDETEYRKRSDQLEQLAKCAGELLEAMRNLSEGPKEAIESIEGHCVFSSAPPVELPSSVDRALRSGSGLLDAGWDWVSAIQIAASHAAKLQAFDKGSRPSQHAAAALAFQVADEVLRMTGKPPPKDRSSWFAEFAKVLGDCLHLQMGPHVVAEAIAKLHTQS